jgi:hypothetical protein
VAEAWRVIRRGVWSALRRCERPGRRVTGCRRDQSDNRWNRRTDAGARRLSGQSRRSEHTLPVIDTG